MSMVSAPANIGITGFRSVVLTILRERSPTPAYGYLPDNVAHLPCFVVGRPTITETGTASIMRLTLEVFALGRRVNDEDSQYELDVLGDELFVVLGATKAVRVDEQSFYCTGVRPGTVMVAGLEHPAYLATVTISTTTC